MFNFFESIGNIFSTVVDFVVNLFQYLIWMAGQIVEAVNSIMLGVALLPDFVKAGAIAILMLAAGINLLNKGG